MPIPVAARDEGIHSKICSAPNFMRALSTVPLGHCNDTITVAQEDLEAAFKALGNGGVTFFDTAEVSMQSLGKRQRQGPRPAQKDLHQLS